MNWNKLIKQEEGKAYFPSLKSFIAGERSKYTVYPAPNQIYNSFSLFPLNKTKVVILGMDPYHNGVAHGLSFSVLPQTRIPPSLINIFKELKSDIDINNESGCLLPWAKQGVLLLNSGLTVREGEPGSHIRNWTPFTDRVIEVLDRELDSCVFILWGNFARTKKSLIRKESHLILESSHPSPLGAHVSFFGSKPFSKTNSYLESKGLSPIDWRV